MSKTPLPENPMGEYDNRATVHVGAVVWFFLQDLDKPNHPLFPMPGIVYRVHSDFDVDLAVFGEIDQPTPLYQKVRYCQQDTPLYKHWTYPPRVVVQ